MPTPIGHGLIWQRTTQRITRFLVDTGGPPGPTLGHALWSPDGRQLAFVGTWREADRAQTRDATVFSIPPGCWDDAACPGTLLISDPDMVVVRASWLPDSRHMLVVADDTVDPRSMDDYHDGLFLLDTAEGTTTEVLRSRTVAQAIGSAPRPTTYDNVWPVFPASFFDAVVSPDGQHAAFLFYAYAFTEPVTTEMRLMFLNLADGTFTPTDYVIQGALPRLNPVGLAWGPPLPDGVLLTPPTPAP